MVVPRVELFTDAECGTPQPGVSPGTNDIVREAAAAGAAMGVHEMHPHFAGPPIVVHNLACHERGELGVRGVRLPALAINGLVVLQGPAWTASDVRRLVQRAAGGGAVPSLRALEASHRRLEKLRRRGDRRHGRSARRRPFEPVARVTPPAPAPVPLVPELLWLWGPAAPLSVGPLVFAAKA